MDPDERDRQLGEAIDGYVEALRAGERVEPESWASRFPEVAAELRECLAALPLLASVPPVEPAEPDESAPARLRGYTILGEVGRGGMGVVYKALQSKTKRLVALKFLAPALAASAAARRRFEREVELAGALDHPGIVRVLESGEANGWLYCAMEFIEGEPLHEFFARSRASIQDILALFVQIAEALHYAHLRAVVHRDLKPSNVLVDNRGRARVLDFGLARFAEPGNKGSETVTKEGQLVGTLPYLSPEQAGGAAGEVDIRSDLYALGVMLYEALAGRPPYSTSGPLFEALQRIQNAVPPRPSQFRPEVPADLDAIARKALEKPKEERYQTAGAFAEDLRCVLRGEPVEANRTSAFYLLRKAYARHRRQFQLAGVAMVFLLASSAAILSLYFEVRHERDRLVLQRGLAHLAAGHDKLAEDLIRPAFRARDEPASYWSLVAWHLQNPQLTAITSVGWVTALAFSPDGRRLVAENLDGNVKVWDADTFSIVAKTPGDLEALAASKRRPAAAPGNGTAPGNGKAIESRAAHPQGAGEALWSLGRISFVDACSQQVAWEAAAGLGEPRPTSLWDASPKNHFSWTPALVFSPDGSILAASGWEAMVRLLDSATGDWLGDLRAHGTAVYALAFRPGTRVLAAGSVGEIRVWDLDRLPGVSNWKTDAGTEHVATAISPDGGAIAWAGGRDGSIRFLRPGKDAAPANWHGHDAPVEAIVFDPGGRRLASADRDGTVVVWDAAEGNPVHSQHTGMSLLRGLAFSPDGERLALGGMDGRVRIVRAGSGATEREWSAHAGPIFALAFSPDGTTLASGGADWKLKLWRPGEEQPTNEWRHSEWVNALAFSPDGSLLASGSADLLIRIGAPAGTPRVPARQSHAHWVTALAFLDGGRVLVSGGNDDALRFWDSASGEELSSLSLHLGPIQSLCVSRDGRKLFVGAVGAVQLLDLGAAFDRIARERTAAAPR